ncbi:transglutaminase-like domain-containing protein [Flavobacterium gilvum]|uniref:Transglutaminase-like domain-containing protein n=1 Tax=Flavobacterium gilvum TaxID=1492737 RepID=A0AAC9N7E5_9FLAO|nr:transglutaminase domain-containing protein [Flavobacterium gilvum]AOW10303.1 hypothetical protein EM308_12745 [Flavobacterium gilvum]KFC58159.1 hypothetical protein FEM08_30490 [Flavobacterium gilvum]
MKFFANRIAIIAFFMFVAGCHNVISQKKNRPFLPKYETLLTKALEKSGDRKDSIRYVLNSVPKNQLEGASFLIAYMPERDLKSLSVKFIKHQIDGAYKVRDQYSWCAKLPDSIFFNEVLPYYSFDENRDNWRNDFYIKFSPLVKDCKDIRQAIDIVNKNIRDILLVDYNVKRSKTNISPLQAIKEKMATCTGLSILLVDAFRSVGIPARAAGTPMWTNLRGNHNWVEVWIDGEWFFTEYYPDALNKSWFLADAGKADVNNPKFWIYASSYKPTNTNFPLVWDKVSKDVHAENVTKRYITLYEKQQAAEALQPDEVYINFTLYSKNSGNNAQRVAERITIKQQDKEINFGFSPSPTDDLNKFLKFRLKKNNKYQVIFTDTKGIAKQTEIAVNDKEELFKLYKE